MRRLFATLAGIALATGMSALPAQAQELPTTSYSISAETSVETTSHESAVVRQAPLAVINADDAARPTTENQPSMFLSSKNLLILGAGLVIVALVSGFSVRSAMKSAEENTIL